jgi:Cu+-exporting ATPase
VYSLLADHRMADTYYSLNDRPGHKQAEPAQAQGYLDEEETFRSLIDVSDGDRTTITLQLPAIHCSSCLWLLERLYRLHPGIGQVEVSLPRKQATITFSRQQLPLSELVRLLQRIGYPPQLSGSGTRGQRPNGVPRRLLYQIGVAGFCFGNLMLLSLPEYTNAGEVPLLYRRLFAFISLLLSIPVLFYAGRDYLRSSWQGLLARRFVIDQPLALGMLAMLGVSLWEILTDTGMGYLDSLAALIFFLLLGKYFQARTYLALAFDRDYRAYLPLASLRLEADGQERPVPVRQLAVGDRIRVRHGEVVPADAELLSATATLDYSFATGESHPIPAQRGEAVYAGARVLGTSLELRVQRPMRQSQISRLWNLPAFRKEYKGEQTESERLNLLGRYFTLAILVLATGTALYWLWADPSQALFAATSVLIVACPCALAIAIPFTYGHMSRILGHQGLYLRRADVVEQLAGLDTLVFDKTGTLTQPGTLAWQAAQPQAAPMGPEAEQLVATLAAQSTHPLSRALHARLHAPEPPAPVAELAETPGMGVQGRVGGHSLRLGSASYAGATGSADGAADSQVHVQLDGQYVGHYSLQARYRPHMQQWLGSLGQDYRLHLLSGDQPTDEAQLRPLFAHLQFRQQPESKLTYMEQLAAAGHRAAMLGDGLNDAGALRVARVGIAVTEDTSSFSPAADAILHADSLPRLPQLLALARHSRRNLHTCTALSLVYNLIGLSFAVQGTLAPVVAAILMPLSSVGVVGLSTWLCYRDARRLGLNVKK